MEAVHRGPLGGMIVIAVDAGTEIRSDAGEIEIVTDDNAVVSRKGALYVTPNVYERIKAAEPPAG
jgi:hypothetical protein